MLTPPPPVSIAGIPIVYDQTSSQIAEARGLWPCKRIVIGPAWRRLTQGEQLALLWHEVKHCQALHLEKRLLMLPLLWTRWVRNRAHAQELECDAYAAEKGCGADMARALRRFTHTDDDPFHPEIAVRVAHLAKLMQGEKYALAS